MTEQKERTEYMHGFEDAMQLFVAMGYDIDPIVNTLKILHSMATFFADQKGETKK